MLKQQLIPASLSAITLFLAFNNFSHTEVKADPIKQSTPHTNKKSKPTTTQLDSKPSETKNSNKETKLTKELSPAELELMYNNAWKTINYQYYDRTFGGQDFKTWAHKYDGTLASNEKAYTAIETMLASLNNKQTRLIRPEKHKNPLQVYDGRAPIKITLSSDKKRIVISDVDEGFYVNGEEVPSRDDTIVKINNQSVSGYSLWKTRKLLDGPASTKVSIECKRKNGSVAQYSLTRLTKIDLPVISTVFPNGIGYILLNNTSGTFVLRDLSNALNQMSSAKGIVLDLRKMDYGGLNNLDSIASQFLPKDTPIFKTADANGYANTVKINSDTQLLYNGLLIVLTSKDTSGGVEILALALKSNNRCKLLGTCTAGLVTIDTFIPIGLDVESKAGMVVSVARWYGPLNENIHKTGIQPDILIASTSEQDGPWWQLNPDSVSPDFNKLEDIQLLKAVEIIDSESKNN